MHPSTLTTQRVSGLACVHGLPACTASQDSGASLPHLPAEATAQGIAELQARAARQRAASTSSTGSQQEQTASSPVELPAEGSFSDADDDALSSALSQRIRQITVAASEPEASQTDEDNEEEGVVEQQPLSAEELRSLVYAKYGKTHDLVRITSSLQ